MVGKGSTRHNSRQFTASNVDADRSHLNIDFCNENIKTVYHELFDASLARYNEKQTRSDRCISNYYEKICAGKQEKPFHEIILQIGNREDTPSDSPMGEQAKAILADYYRDFQKRNPNLRVFSAHLHMDEATPHLHIDFVPYITGSKRGLDTRVSLKQALGSMGFRGGTRGDTEWNQWVQAEKEQLAAVMERYDIQWEQKGTHEKHLSVLDYKKQERSLELAELESKCSEREKDYQALQKEISIYEKATVELPKMAEDLEQNPAYQLPEPERLMTAKTYKTKIVEPLIAKLKSLCKNLLVQYFKLDNLCTRLYRENSSLWTQNRQYRDSNEELYKENKRLHGALQDYALLRRVFGREKMDEMLQEAKNIQLHKGKNNNNER